jgi:segregation and condensation protein A
LFKIKLNHFEGPLDLLLFFIKRDELNIYDIPISYITKEFLGYVNLIKMLDLEVAGDFILMASTLMHIKVRMLLPKEIDEKGEEIDPRSDLVNALLEYKRYKEMSDELGFFETAQRKISYRGYYSLDPKEAPPELDTLLKNISVYDLAKAFRKAIDNIKKEFVHEIKNISVSIDEQITFVLSLLSDAKEISFMELIRDMHERIRIVVTFIALLELTKMGQIGIKESFTSDDFIIYGIITNG